MRILYAKRRQKQPLLHRHKLFFLSQNQNDPQTRRPLKEAASALCSLTVNVNATDRGTQSEISLDHWKINKNQNKKSCSSLTVKRCVYVREKCMGSKFTASTKNNRFTQHANRPVDRCSREVPCKLAVTLYVHIIKCVMTGHTSVASSSSSFSILNS